MAWADWVTFGLFVTELFGSDIKVRFKRRTFHVPNLIIRFGTWKLRRMNQLGSSTDLYLGRPTSRMERQKLDTERPHVPSILSNLSTAFMIGCQKLDDRSVLELNMLELDPPLKTVDWHYLLSIYSFLTCTSIWSPFPWTQKKLLRLGVYKCSNPGAKTNYWNEMEWK